MSDISIGDLKTALTVLENLQKRYHSEKQNLLEYEIEYSIYIMKMELRNQGVEV